MRNSTTASSQIRSDVPVYNTPERTVRGHIHKKTKDSKNDAKPDIAVLCGVL